MALLKRPREQGEHVGELGVEPGQQRDPLGSVETGRDLACELAAAVGEAKPGVVGAGVPGQLLRRILAHGLEHRETVALADEQLLGDQRVQGVLDAVR